ncbi:DUF2771 domain-containing protein [Mycobacterium sp. M1]|uniref:DUF2771 domain-containing protein n=1 Tax=Mycolicibacter acidiphilus TaxID=2835306 RepID=A0ABS5RDG9_9MYCO|nr:DUF2771 domain-containing protein [Mycolicibacter acidiphilus]MBS9532333.1 DUF2771 domain-containing protein [Mycolicibacter acidiphilus]
MKLYSGSSLQAKRSTVVLVVALVLLAAFGAGFGAWQLSRNEAPQQPQISAYSNGHLTRTEPYLYCEVLDLDECVMTKRQGELPVDRDHPIQLSVDSVISQSPWRLLLIYRDPADTTTSFFRPGTKMALTIPSVDPQRGPLRGLVVQLLTMVIDPVGEMFEAPHAEWAVRTVWEPETV